MPLAMGTAGLTVAAVFIGKAVRDTLLVSSFPVKAIPFAPLGTAVASVIAVAIYTRVSTHRSPRDVAPRLAMFVALSLVVAWFFVRTRSQVATAFLYAWLTITGTLVVSSFWALLSELLDVRAARRSIGLLTLASSIGAVVGSLAASAFVSVAGPVNLLLVLVAINILIVLFLGAMAARGTPKRPAISVPPNSARSGLREGVRGIVKESYLRDVACLVAATAIAGTLADLLLKYNAGEKIALVCGADRACNELKLGQFFTRFHGVVAGFTLAVQLLLARPLLQRKGLATTLAILPGFLMVGALGFAALPGMVAAAGLRGGETAVRNSFHKAAYELLFVPVRAETRRSTKPILDNLLERGAEGLGSLTMLALIAICLGPASAQTPAVVLIAALGLVAGYFVLRVRRGYVRSLTTNLVDQGAALRELSLAVESDGTARRTMQLTLGGDAGANLREKLSMTSVGRTFLGAVQVAADGPGAGAPKSAPGGTLMAGVASEPRPKHDPALSLVRDLQSTNVEALETAVRAWDGRDRRAVPFIIQLLAHDDLYLVAVEALTAHVDRHVGALSDELRDVDGPFGLRRRIPRVLAHASSEAAAVALSGVLADERFEVRYHSARALRKLAVRGVPISKERMWAAVRHDVKKALPLWEAQRLIDEGLEDEHKSVREAVAHRGAYGLRHIFNLLALVLEPEPADLAYRSLNAEDPHVRAVALEYLENVLPADVRIGLWPYIGDAPGEIAPVSKRAVNEILVELKNAERRRAT